MIDVKADNAPPEFSTWEMKQISEEKDMRQKLKRKGDEPSGQSKRKHQITYLAHQVSFFYHI